MADFGDIASGAGSGALTGFSIGGPWGAAIGGVAGGLLSAFSPKQKQQEYHNPYELQIEAGIDRLLNSQTGAQTAQRQGAAIQEQGRDAYSAIQSNTGVSGNAAVMASAYNKVGRGVSEGVTGANLAGARVDQDRQAQGLQLQMSQSQNKFGESQYNQGIRNANNQPGFFQTLLQSSLAQGTGTGLGKLMGGDSSADLNAGRPNGISDNEWAHANGTGSFQSWYGSLNQPRVGGGAPPGLLPTPSRPNLLGQFS